jgi:hypothetical protein
MHTHSYKVDFVLNTSVCSGTFLYLTESNRECFALEMYSFIMILNVYLCAAAGAERRSRRLGTIIPYFTNTTIEEPLPTSLESSCNEERLVTASNTLGTYLEFGLVSIHRSVHNSAHNREQASALPLTTAEGNQVNVIINYGIGDESLLGQRINAIMGIYDREKSSLVKLSSFRKYSQRED